MYASNGMCCCHICLSVTCQYCIKTDKRRIMQTMPHDSRGTKFLDVKDLAEIQTRTLLWGAPNAGGVN